MAEAAAPPATRIGSPTPRVDGDLKVTGRARYGSDFAPDHPAWAYLAVSRIASGQITAIETAETRGTPGVLDVITWREAADAIKPGQTFSKKGYMGSSIAPLASPRIWHAGQIVAVVVAETFEAAREGAHRLNVTYTETPPAASFGSPGAEPVEAKAVSPSHEDPHVGDAESAFAAAPVKIDARYSTPTQHHNPIELFTTVCAWAGGRLTVWESSQNMWGFKNGLAEQLTLEPAQVRTISPYVGGAFGSRGSLTQRTALVALAARRLGRPVKLVASRSQGFTIATYRAETRHHVRLAASPEGKLTALVHDGSEVTSRPDDYMVSGTDATTRVYACPNVASNVTIVHADRNTPGFMRAPPETPYMFALESAMDELAYALKMDPVALRLANDTQVEPINGLRYTSRHLAECFEAGAKTFGWERRASGPGQMRDGDWLVGYGCATALYPTQVAPASARVTLAPDGSVKVQCATHEIGNGITTALALTAADRLGIPLNRIAVELGDSDLPPAPVAGGSNSTASCCTVVAMACDHVRARLAGETPQNGSIEAYAESVPHDAPADAIKALYRGKAPIVGGAKMKDRIQFAFGAHFVEVRVHSLTGEVRAPRAVGAFAAGRIVNPLAAKSQLMGGMIWGISAALHEATEIDERAARYYNTDLAEYLVPVNADIGEVEVLIVPEDDTLVNPLGVKGIGELGIVGMNAAVANAVFHATGARVRDLPVRMEKLLASPALRRRV